jgi:putative FmdB family regulatory protein
VIETLVFVPTGLAVTGNDAEPPCRHSHSDGQGCRRIIVPGFIEADDLAVHDGFPYRKRCFGNREHHRGLEKGERRWRSLRRGAPLLNHRRCARGLYWLSSSVSGYFTDMPIYEYRCDRCDQTFEVIQKFSDQPIAVHEGCGGAVERLVSSSALQFKGSGWYVTDYGRKNGSSSGGRSESKGDSGSSDKKESKPAAKAETSSTKSDKK